MGAQDVLELDEEQQHAFTRALLNDVRALEKMLADGLFETEVRRIGAEQEMFLVDSGFGPAPLAIEVLKRLDDPMFTTELARFNLEANLPPYVFGGACLSEMEACLDGIMAKARAAARAESADVLLCGILPTLQVADLTVENMTPMPRYDMLNRAMIRQAGGEFKVNIEGTDSLNIVHDNVMLEACNTSFQVHFQVDGAEFAKLYNVAQAITGPVLAAAVNAPLLLGKRLWHETRVALFQHSVDDRSDAHRARGRRPRVRFGDAWIESSVLEIFRDDIARFRIMIGNEREADAMEVLAAGGTPELNALRLHNGTVYRWNRPCYGIIDGKPHLRIENRVLPSGPTVVDEIANAAFFFGLMAGVGDAYGDITEVMPFASAKANFLAAAKYGLQARFSWLGERTHSAGALILNELLPLARSGLESRGIEPADIDRYLGVIKARVQLERTGARWALSSLAKMPEGTKVQRRLRALTGAMLDNQQSGEPVHTWPLAELPTGDDWRHSYATVGRCMTDDLITVHPEDLVDLAANQMIWQKVRYIPVEDDAGKLVGLVTHRGLLRLLADGKGDRPVAVRDIMLTDVVTASPSSSTLHVIALMRDHAVSCVPIVQDGKLVGVVTESDLLEVAAKLFEDGLREMSTPPADASQRTSTAPRAGSESPSSPDTTSSMLTTSE